SRTPRTRSNAPSSIRRRRRRPAIAAASRSPTPGTGGHAIRVGDARPFPIPLARRSVAGPHQSHQPGAAWDMEIFLQQLVNSLSVASVTILIGIGITLVFGLAGIVNFAQGEFLMVGGMTTWALVGIGLNFFLAIPVAMAVVGFLGLVAERGLFRFTLAVPMNGFI